MSIQISKCLAAEAGTPTNTIANSISARTLAEVWQKLILDAPLYALIGIYWIIGYLYLSLTGRIEVSNFLIYFELLFPLLGFSFPTFLIMYSLIKATTRLKKRRVLAYKLMMRPDNLARVISSIILIAGICIFIGMFTSIKSSFAALQGFQHDLWQADLDKILFFGNEPWHILFKPFHSTTLQSIIEVNYNVLWHIQTYAILFFVCVSPQNKHYRKRYITSYILLWAIVGNLFAGIFISAGPAFYENITGDASRFSEQVAMLASYGENSVVNYQNYLWSAFETNSTSFGTGISAFPSVHVSIVTLNAFFAFEVNKKLGIFAVAYALFVAISSVYLAWHYAIDGIFGAMIVALIYYGTKYFWTKPKKNLPVKAS